jgi:HEAT repeat protein
MQTFCPNCWSLLDDDFDVCPKCNFDIKDFSNKDYEKKLIRALEHPLHEVRTFAVEVIAKKKYKEAVPKLLQSLESTDDIYFQKAIIEALSELEPNDLPGIVGKYTKYPYALIVREAARKAIKNYQSTKQQ